VAARKHLTDDVLVLPFGRQRKHRLPRRLELLPPRLRQRPERKLGALRQRRHPRCARNEHLVAGPHARSGERDERPEVAGTAGGREEDAHPHVDDLRARHIPAASLGRECNGYFKGIT
jgi:hypothetical protein